MFTFTVAFLPNIYGKTYRDNGSAWDTLDNAIICDNQIHRKVVGKQRSKLITKIKCTFQLESKHAF